VNKRKLALLLSILKENPNPKYKLEQYSITPEIASEILFLARNDIKDKIVFDFGTGSGRLAIGAALLGAKLVFGIDIDKNVLEIAKENLKLVEEKTGLRIRNVEWIWKDIRELKMEGDTVIQFPPISGREDLIFLRKALESAKKVYSIHRFTKARKKKIEEIVKEFSAKIDFEKKFKYKLPWKEKGKFGYELLLISISR